MKQLKLAFLLLSLVNLLACQKDEGNQAEIDRMKIIEYLTANNITAQEDPSGLFYVINKVGTGGSPTVQSLILVRYKGYLLDGTVFDQGTITDYPLGGLIQGWQIGIPLLKKGGKGTFFVPSRLGYGNQATGNIPKNSVLIFEVELVDYN